MADKFVIVETDNLRGFASAKFETELEAIEELKEQNEERDPNRSELVIMMECHCCQEFYEIGETCGCPESLDEAEQLLIDNAAEAKSERQRGY